LTDISSTIRDRPMTSCTSLSSDRDRRLEADNAERAVEFHVLFVVDVA
jgi:hypothetical protein